MEMFGIESDQNDESAKIWICICKSGTGNKSLEGWRAEPKPEKINHIFV